MAAELAAPTTTPGAFFRRVNCAAPACNAWLLSVRGEGSEIEVLCRRCKRITIVDAHGEATGFRNEAGGRIFTPAPRGGQGPQAGYGPSS